MSDNQINRTEQLIDKYITLRKKRAIHDDTYRTAIIEDISITLAKIFDKLNEGNSHE
jgi:hypothetical protein